MSESVTDPIKAREWMIAERKRRGWSTIKLSDEARAIAQREGSDMRLTQQSISGFETGSPKRIPEWLRYVRMAFEEGEAPRSNHVERRDELVYVKQLDIRLAMGDGTEIEEHADAQLIPFNLGFIQSMSRAPTDKLFIATGFGDSMEPVLLKHDLVLIDTTDRDLAAGDTIWALEYAGAGYIKRVRSVMRDGHRMLMILSANPDYPPELALPQDVRIIGKVALVVRRT
jgi:hypothetical protein